MEKQDVVCDSAIKRTLMNPETHWKRPPSTKGLALRNCAYRQAWWARYLEEPGAGRDGTMRFLWVIKCRIRVAMAAQLSEYSTTTLKSWILWYVNHISMKPLWKKMLLPDFVPNPLCWWTVQSFQNIRTDTYLELYFPSFLLIFAAVICWFLKYNIIIINE